ncbi:TetR/AcrR family transcriptional regulator [Collinsella tanakaei]|uniref:TetR/AcrR family transcriptional regulator n=1 Tax=Collinsella tanakaei TaxID=626935 RepID=UPI0025A3B453|nr:TetR/AcrR family transcriptional regulator [Collinsella tanakaei]MDM8246893.1 TetR/AcrR family transcriptional regulator [Collinsella tanakaei]
MKKQPHVTEQTRANLTQAFWELYLERPIEKITVREITERAGYNRATFYLYYRDVYDLFEQLEEEVLSQVRELVQQRLLSEEQLDFSHHMDFIVKLAQRFDGLMPRLMNGDPSFGERMKEIIAPLLDRFIMPEGGLEADEQDILREFYLSGLLGSINAWLASNGRVPIERLVELIVGAALPARTQS